MGKEKRHTQREKDLRKLMRAINPGAKGLLGNSKSKRKNSSCILCQNPGVSLIHEWQELEKTKDFCVLVFSFPFSN